MAQRRPASPGEPPTSWSEQDMLPSERPGTMAHWLFAKRRKAKDINLPGTGPKDPRLETVADKLKKAWGSLNDPNGLLGGRR